MPKIIQKSNTLCPRQNDAHRFFALIVLTVSAARIILNADILTPSESMFKELQWLSFSKRVLYHKSVMMFKALHGMAPEYLSEMFVKTSQIHSRS